MFSKEEIELAQNEIAGAYLQAVLELLSYSGQDEVNFMKKTIEMPDGGIYLLQLQHVSGPKISLNNIFKNKHD